MPNSKNNISKFSKALQTLLKEAEKENIEINLKQLKLTTKNIPVTQEYCESIGMVMKCKTTPSGIQRCYCVLPPKN